MSELVFYGLKTCDTCRKALKEMSAAGLVPDVFDVRDDGIPRGRLDALISALGVDAIVNRRSTTWRGLDDAERARALDPASAPEVLTANPTLIKRPIIFAKDGISVGWTDEVRASLLG